MLICMNCRRVNPDDADKCVGCGKAEFEQFDLTSDWLKEWEEEYGEPPFYNSIEPYLENDKNGEQK